MENTEKSILNERRKDVSPKKESSRGRLSTIIGPVAFLVVMVLLLSSIVMPRITLAKVEAAYETLKEGGSLTDGDIRGIKICHGLSLYFDSSAKKNMDSLINDFTDTSVTEAIRETSSIKAANEHSAYSSQRTSNDATFSLLAILLLGAAFCAFMQTVESRRKI